MTMELAKNHFQQREAEVRAHLALLESISVQRTPKSNTLRVSADQAKILFAATYLILYNLIESTMVNSLEAVEDATRNCGLSLRDLSDDVHREWVRGQIPREGYLREKGAIDLSIRSIGNTVSDWKIRRRGGSWDDKMIEATAKELGISLSIRTDVRRRVKHPYRDDLGALGYLKKVRNDLAHGTISFVECGQDMTYSTVEDLSDATMDYASDVLTSFDKYIDGRFYLRPSARGAGA